MEEVSLEQVLESPKTAHGGAVFALFLHLIWFGSSSWGEWPGPRDTGCWAPHTWQVLRGRLSALC